MSLTTSIARLYRAGDEHAKQWKKLSDAVAELVTWLGENFPLGEELPCNCRLREQSSKLILVCIDKETSQDKDGPQWERFWLYGTGGERNERRHIFALCDLIVKEAWLDKVSESLECWATQYQKSSSAIESSLGKWQKKNS